MLRNPISTRIRNLLISLATVVALVFLASAYTEPVLRVSVMPGEPPPVLRSKLKPLIDYLEKKIGMKMEFRPVRDGDDLVESLLRKKLDMVWIDGPDFALAQSRSSGQVMRLVQRTEAEKSRPPSPIAPGHDDYSWAVRADMDAGLRLRLTDAFLALDRNNGEDKAILDLQGAGRFIPVKAGN